MWHSLFVPAREHSCRQQRAISNVEPKYRNLRNTTTDASGLDPRSGLVKVACGLGETLDLLSTGRRSLHAAVKRCETPVKFDKKTPYSAIDLVTFLAHLKEVTANSNAASCDRPTG